VVGIGIVALASTKTSERVSLFVEQSRRNVRSRRSWVSHFCFILAIALQFHTCPLEAQSHSESAISIEQLQQEFQDPPDDARIMMRWWWFGPAVNEQELERELRTMKEGGIGGVEIQPVYPLALDDPQRGFRNLPYLSDDFLRELRFASEKARELGLRVDLTLGSGWPYGGSQVPITEAAGRLRVEHIRVGGNSSRVPLPYMVAGEKLLAVFLTPADKAKSADAYREITQIDNGAVILPKDLNGQHDLLIFIASRTGMMVKRAAVGAEGFVVDHYDHGAVEHYLNYVGDRLMQAFASNLPTAIFCDSLEAYGSDWTSDFLEQFQKRRGYDLRPYLPALAEDIGPKTAEIRHDWGETLTELFNENFASTVRNWAKQHGTKFRMQGYGIPPAELSSSALADLPEGEGADWKRLAATRWASSASHIYGVPITSSETWTWLHSPVFRATPLDMKAEADRHFLQGINQLVGHGWPYTAEGVEYPGWRFYAAAVFDEKNPWWIVMPDITRYLQRVSYLLRRGQPGNYVAVYLPTNDAWASFRPGEADLFQKLRDHLGSKVLPSILESGFNVDFFDDAALGRVGHIESGKLTLGQNSYSAVVLPDVERMPLETLSKLEQFVRAGGVLIATGRPPSLVPGFRATEADQQQLRQTTRRLFEGASAPGHLASNQEDLGRTLSQFLTPDIAFSPAAPEVGFVHRKLQGGEMYFLANTGNTKQTTVATFRLIGLHPEWWDPMSGKVSTARVIRQTEKGTSLSLELEPYASRVLVFSGRTLTPSTMPSSAPSQTIDISRGWNIAFGESGHTITEDQLHAWTDDPGSRYFSGIAKYKKTVSVPATMLRSNNSVRLDLGEGQPLSPQPLRAGMQAWFDAPVREAAVVYVNGKRAGSVWCPPYSVEITSLTHSGQNDIEIDVANLALNYMAGHSLPDYRLLNLRYGTRFEAQDMDKVQPIPAGLLGPIHLVSFENPKQQ